MEQPVSISLSWPLHQLLPQVSILFEFLSWLPFLPSLLLVLRFIIIIDKSLVSSAFSAHSRAGLGHCSWHQHTHVSFTWSFNFPLVLVPFALASGNHLLNELPTPKPGRVQHDITCFQSHQTRWPPTRLACFPSFVSCHCPLTSLFSSPAFQCRELP